MIKNIVILPTGHLVYDDRLYYKFSLSLKKYNYKIYIILSNENFKYNESNISIIGFNNTNLTKRKKINKFFEILKEIKPSLIICAEPLTILPGNKYQNKINSNCKIISDVTEWYPEYVAFKFKGIKKLFVYILLYLFNIYSSYKTDFFTFGERSKKKKI